MADRDLWTAVSDAISTASGEKFVPTGTDQVGGGCINEACVLHGSAASYFIKLNSASQLDMFEAEAAGLNEIIRSQSVRAPVPLTYGTAAGRAWLVMEFLELGGRARDSMESLGRQLAAMHRTTQSQFGWWRDNTIGSTPQINTRCEEWAAFWINERLRFQFDLAAGRGHGGRLQQRGELLMDACAALLTEHGPQASLLHGDLWSGNYSICRDGMPAIFDPAVYYGDRETDIAMTELFGGFSGDFYRAYDEAWPLNAGYRIRRMLYNLYHILNHLNLFGAGYRGQAEQMIDTLLAELR